MKIKKPNRLIYSNFIIDKGLLQNLKNVGFLIYCKSKEDGTFLAKRFTVLRYNKHPVLIGEIVVNNDSGDFVVNVYDTQGNAYAPFYYDRYDSHTAILNKIFGRINCELKKIGIQRKEHND